MLDKPYACKTMTFALNTNEKLFCGFNCHCLFDFFCDW